MVRMIGLIILVSSWQLHALSPSAAIRAVRSARGAMSKNISESAHLRAMLEQLRSARTHSRSITRSNADSAKEGIYIGIDLGTTNSVVSVVSEADNAIPEVLVNLKGSKLTPSVVQFDEAGKAVKIGADAVNNSINAPADTISSVKRFIGSKYDDAIKEIETDDLPYKVVQGADGRVAIELSNGQTILPEQVSAEVLSHLLGVVKKQYPNQEIKGVVITVPERFLGGQRDATLDAAEIAGFPVKDEKVFLVNEPSAAAVSYGLDKGKESEKVLVFDLGGGTTDLAILDIVDNDFDTVATAGHAALGGDNIDEAIVKALRARVEADAGFELNEQGMDMLRKQAIEAKHTLSTSEQAQINVNAVGSNGFKLVQVELTRADLEAMIEDFVAQSDDMLNELLSKITEHKLSAMSPDEISEVVFVGGTTRIPLFQKKVAELFPNSNLHFGENPDEAVSLGAAIFAKANFTKGSDVSLVQKNNIPIGVKTHPDVFSEIYPEGKDIPGSGFLEGLGAMEDNQPSVLIEVYQGGRPRATDNKLLGGFNVQLDTVRKAHEHSFRIDLSLDRNGVATVEFKDVNTGMKKSHTIESGGRLSEDDIARMKNARLLNEEEDKAFEALIEQRGKLTRIISQGQNMLDDPHHKISGATRAEVEAAITEAKALIDGSEPSMENLVAKFKDLEAKLHKMSDEVSGTKAE